MTCVDGLLALREADQIVIDDAYRILSEYQSKTMSTVGRRVGDAFVKWILQNSANATRVLQVPITENEPDSFAEIPDAVQAVIDPADRKFVAVAAAHAERPPIWQASDCKWLDWLTLLQGVGITLRFLCPQDVRRFYASKFPGKAVPDPP